MSQNPYPNSPPPGLATQLLDLAFSRFGLIVIALGIFAFLQFGCASEARADNVRVVSTATKLLSTRPIGEIAFVADTGTLYVRSASGWTPVKAAPNVTPGTSGNVLTSNGTAWTSAASSGGGSLQVVGFVSMAPGGAILASSPGVSVASCDPGCGGSLDVTFPFDVTGKVPVFTVFGPGGYGEVQTGFPSATKVRVLAASSVSSPVGFTLVLYAPAT